MRMCATSAQRGAQGGRDLRGRWRLRPTCALLERVLGSRRRHRPALGTLLAGGALLAITGVLGGVDVHPATALAAAPVVLPLVAAAQEPEPDDEESAEPTEADRAAERAAKRAARRAEATHKAHATWELRNNPHRLVILREDRIDVVADGRLVRQIDRYGPVTITDLDRALPPAWVEVVDGGALLGATVVLTSGAGFEVGGDIHTLELLGGPSPPDAASIHTGGGALALRGVTVTSADPTTRQPLPPTALGRPSIVVSSGGRLDAVDSSIRHLGAPSSGVGGARSGVVFNPGSSGSLIRTVLHGNVIGLELSRSEQVHLEHLTISGSVGNGLVLSGDRRTTMSGVRAVGNGGNGVVVNGESSDRPVTGIVTTGNDGYGVMVVGQTGTTLVDITTATDEAGGLRINRSTGLHVTDFTAIDQPVGVFTHVGSRQIVLDHLRITGGGRGVVAEMSTQGLAVRASTIDSARLCGVSLAGTDMVVEHVRVSGARTGVRVERGARGVRIAGLVVTGGRDGIVTTPGTSGVVLADVVAIGVEADAIRTASPQAEITGGRITGATTGIDVVAATTVSGIAIDGAEVGIHSRSPDPVRADHVAIDAIEVGVNATGGSGLQLAGSRVHAPEALRGEVRQRGANDLSLPPLSLIGAIGVPLILLAVVLEEVHSFRQRRRRPARHAPPAVLVGAGVDGAG